MIAAASVSGRYLSLGDLSSVYSEDLLCQKASKERKSDLKELCGIERRSM